MTIDNGLWKAADVLREGGFVKNDLATPEGAHCAIGAYVAGYGKDFGNATAQAGNWAQENHKDEIDVLAETIDELFPNKFAAHEGYGKVVKFNDAVSTTEEDVVRVFRVAAVKLAVQA